jgi:ribosome-associated protein
MSHESASLSDRDARPSKTRLKGLMHELQSLGEALVALPQAKLDAIELPEALRDAFGEYRRTRSHEGRRRQLQYIGKLMRGVDAEPLREAVARERLPGARETLALHEVERWRDVLIADDDALARFVARHPAGDATALRRLVRAARAEPQQAGARHGRSYRELFQRLKEAIDHD